MVEDKVFDAAQRAGLCADTLTLGRSLDLWSSGLALVALGALLLAPAPPAAPLWAILALALPARYFALRVRFDEAVFRRWASVWGSSSDNTLPALTMAAFDRALGRTPGGRALVVRCRGARRLLCWLALTTLLQMACAVAAAMYSR